MISVLIDGEEVVLKKNSLNISSKIEQRETCSFVVVDTEGQQRFYKGQPVTVKFNDTTQFVGIVLSSEITETTQAGDRWHQIRSAGHHYAADKRLATKVYENELAGDIVRDLYNSYLKEEGIRIGTRWYVYEGMTWKEVIE